MGRRSACERVAHLLCEAFTRFDAVGLASRDEGEARSFAWPVTQAELGDATALSTVHVNRTLQSLRRAGLVATHAGAFTFTNWPGLQGVAGFDPGYLAGNASVA